MASRKQALTIDDVLDQLGSDDDGIDWNDYNDNDEADESTVLECNHPLTLVQMSSDLQKDTGDISLIETMVGYSEVHDEPPLTDANTPTQLTVTPTQLTVTPTQPTTSTNCQPTVTSTQPTKSSTQPTSWVPTPSGTATIALTTASMPFPPVPFQEPVGPKVLLDSTSTALDAFLLFFGEDTFQLLREQTNLYASQSPPGSSYKLYETTVEEIKLFLGMILAMGIHQLPQLEDYWSMPSLLGAQGIVSGMSYR
jgi:hypothetical protein